MPGDIAVRTNVASISTRALRKAFSITSSVAGSIGTRAKGVVFGWIIVAGMTSPFRRA